MPLTPAQLDLLATWLPGHEVLSDMSWGLVDSTVLRVRSGGADYVVKATGPDNTHFARELRAHDEVADRLAGWVATLVAASSEQHIMVLEYLPGGLAERGPTATPMSWPRRGCSSRPFTGSGTRRTARSRHT